MSAGFRAGQANDGYLQINGTDILSVSSGVLGVKNTGAQSEVRLYCESNNAHYASLKSPPHSDFIGNVTFTLPGTAGNNGQVLQTDGSGNLSWVNNSGSGGGGGASDKLSEGNTEAEVIDTGSDGHFKVTTEGTVRFHIDSGGRISLNDGSRLARDVNEGAQLRVTGSPITRNQYYSPHGDYFASFGYTDDTYTKAWIAVDSSYAKSSAVSAGIFLSAFHENAGGSNCGFTIKNLKSDGGGVVFSKVKTAASVNNPAVEEERLRITSAGKMGIGTNNPQEQLVVSNGGAEGFEVTAGVASNINKIVNYNRSGGSYSSLRIDAAEHIFRIGASEKLRIGPSGQIGIGGANYGTSGQVLTSGGASGAVSWTTVSGGGGGYGNSDVDNHLNTGGASSGQILSWNGSDYAWVADQGGSGGGGISDVADDTTPQLGGNLDLNSKNITGTGNITITGTLTSDGISVGDNDKAIFGAGDDLQIYHDGTDSKIDNITGDFILTNTANDKDLRFRTDDGSGSFTNYILCDGSTGAVILSHYSSTKLATTSTGVTVTGTLAATALSGSLATTDLTGTITNAQLAGSIADGKLASTFLKNVVEDSSPQLGGNLDVQANQINTSTSNGNIKLAPNGTGVVEIRGAGGSDGTLQLNCSAQSHGIKLKSPPHSAAASYTLTFPNSIVADKFLKSDASGNLSFSSELTDLVVKQSGSAFTKQSQTVALFQRSSTTGHGAKIAIVGGNAASSDINFGDTDDEDAGLIQYVHTDNSFRICTNSDITNERLRIKSDGQVNINASTESVGGRVVIKNNVDYTTTDFDDNPTLYLLNDDRTTGVSEAAIVFAGRNSAGSTFRAAISGNGSTGFKFYSNNNNAESDDTPALRIDSVGRVGIGTDDPGSPLEVRGGGTVPAQFITTTGSSNGATIRIRKNDANLAVNDKIGAIQFAGDNGTDNYISEFAKIEATVVDATSSSEDGTLKFYTCTNGSSTEKLRIQSGGGISFNGDTAAVNALDDYEEGTWTPTLTTTGTNFTAVSYQVRTGSYTKIGDFVFIRGNFYTTSVTKGSASGNVVVSGLPFTPMALSGACLHDVRIWDENPSTGASINSQSKIFLFRRSTFNGPDSNLQVSDVRASNPGNLCQFTACYKVT